MIFMNPLPGSPAFASTLMTSAPSLPASSGHGALLKQAYFHNSNSIQRPFIVIPPLGYVTSWVLCLKKRPWVLTHGLFLQEESMAVSCLPIPPFSQLHVLKEEGRRVVKLKKRNEKIESALFCLS